MKNEQLYRYHIEIQQLQQTSALGFLLKGRINDFYKENKIRIDALIEKLKQIQHEFLVHDENDLPKFEGIGNDRKATMIEGKTIDEFNRLTKELMDMNVSGLVKL